MKKAIIFLATVLTGFIVINCYCANAGKSDCVYEDITQSAEDEFTINTPQLSDTIIETSLYKINSSF